MSERCPFVQVKQSEAHIWIGGSSTQNQGGVEENVFGPDATTADIIQKSQQTTVITVPAYNFVSLKPRRLTLCIFDSKKCLINVKFLLKKY